MTAPAYEPMIHDRAEYDPAAGPWNYILDDAPPDKWRELVAVAQRSATWPFQPRYTGSRYCSARLSPDWCFYAWGSEYVLADWEPDKPQLVTCRIVVTRRVQHDGWWTTRASLDLASGSFTAPASPCDPPMPADVTAELDAKCGKLLAFFADANRHWRAGDQERPVQAGDLYQRDTQMAVVPATAACSSAAARTRRSPGRRADQ